MPNDTKAGEFKTYSTIKPAVMPACALCGGKAEAVCWDCLYATLATILETMAKDGTLAEVVNKALRESGR